MGISEDPRKLIAKEIDYVVNKMNGTQDAAEKLYYFSGIHSAIQRVFNFEFDLDLVYTHFVLQHTYTDLLARLQAIQKGGERLILLEEMHFKKLSAFAKELGKKIYENKDLNSTLRKFAVLSYSTTGNGYYLQQKGLFKIQTIEK